MESLLRLLDDLHKLEINTIIKDGLTAQKMPAPLLALHQIATEYEDYCKKQGLNIEDTAQASIRRRFGVITKAAGDGKGWFLEQNNSEAHGVGLILTRIADSAETLHGVLKRAKREWDTDQKNEAFVAAFSLLAEKSDDPAYDAFNGRFDAPFYQSFYQRFEPRSIKPELTLFDQFWAERRSEDKTGPILDILYDIPAGKLKCLDRGEVNRAWQLSTADRAMIRKIWELGTERVLVQTVIQIEGDVTNRISPAIEAPEREHLLELHQRGIQTSLHMWGNLVQVAKDLVGALTDALKR